MLAAKKGEFDKALADCDAAIKLDPKTAYNYFARGEAWRAKGDLDKAITEYSEVIRREPTPWVYGQRAICRARKGEHDKVIADCDAAIKLDPKYVIGYQCRGDAWLAKRDLDKAIADFTRAIQLDARNAYAYSRRGWAWSRRGR